MLTGKHPWPDCDNQVSTMYAIVNGKNGPPRPEGISDLARSFLDQCLQYDPSKRPTASQLLEHPWVAVNTTARPEAEAKQGP